jgi:protein-tyrosine-phosphatase/8-oxo-dGTP pyrophosphatase MutT (NUDIX family)
MSKLPYRDVLIVCHANTSRSVIAEHLLRRLLTRAGRDDIVVRSGGIAPYARDGMLVSLDARLVLAEVGVEIPPDTTATDLKSKRHLLAGADLILVMTNEQRCMLDAYPETRGKPVFTLLEFAGESGDVDDPAGRGEDVFRACRQEIARSLEKALPRLIGGGSAALPPQAVVDHVPTAPEDRGAEPGDTPAELEEMVPRSGKAPAPAEETPVRPWQAISTESVYDCRLFSVLRRRSLSPRTLSIHDVFLLRVPDWVNIVPLTAEGHVVMIRQYRHGVEEITLEVPGGMLAPTDTDPAVAARREMLEETGYDSEIIESLGSTHPNPAIQGNRCHTFVARDVVWRRPPTHLGFEHTEPVLVPRAEIPGLVRSGVISHALVIVAFHRLLLVEPGVSV